MHRSATLLCGLLAGTFAGCSSFSDNPLGMLARSGHDARVFNPQTGHYEWPDDTPAPTQRQRQRTAALDEAASESAQTPSKPITPGAGDNRVFNPMTQQYEAPR